MRHLHILIISFFLIPLVSSGQKDSKKSKVKKHTVFIPTFDISTGSRFFTKNVYGQLNSENKFSRPLNFIGIGIGHNHFDPWGPVDKQIFFSSFIPNRISVQDTIQCKMRGYMTSLSICRSLRALFRKKDNGLFHFCFGLGLNVGKIKLNENNIINKSSLFITPKIILSPSIFYKHIIIALTIEYDSDFFQFNWQNKGQNKFNEIKLKTLNQTALTTFVRFSYRIL